MEMKIEFPGGARVDVRIGRFSIQTDQSAQDGGEGAAPTPFDLFLASMATCAGIYVLGFCRKRGLPVENIRMTQRVETNPTTRMVEKIIQEILLPQDFPEKYKVAVIRAAESCKVKKHLENPPNIEVKVFTSETVPS